MRFNVNNYVRVKLTEEGRQILRDEYAKRAAQHPADYFGWSYVEPVADQEGYVRFQLWSFMQKFGPHMHLGMKMPFDAEIDIIEAQK